MYGFETIIEALRKVADDAIPVKIVPGLFSLVGLPEMKALLEMSSAGLVLYSQMETFRGAIGNKAAEYLSYDLPLLIYLKGLLSDLVEYSQCGVLYYNSARLAQSVRALRGDRRRLANQREGSRRLF